MVGKVWKHHITIFVMFFHASRIPESERTREEVEELKPRIMYDDSIFALLYSQLVIQNRILFIS